VIVAAYQAPPATGFGNPDAARIIFFHVPAAITCVVFFVIGAWYAARVLRRKRESDDIKSVAALEMGTLLCVLATVTGSIFAYEQWGSAWNWDPRETTIVAQLLIYAAYFALRGSLSDARRRAVVSAGYAVFAAVTVPFLIFVVPRLPALASLHPADTLTSRSGMDATYRIIFWSATLGYFLLGLLIMRVRVKAGELISGLEDAVGLETGGHTAPAHRLLGADGLPVGGRTAAGSSGERSGQET
jgi:heme exporter protein C